MRNRRVRTPTLIQIEAAECGAVALGIIMGYYGKYVPIEELRTACGVSRSGSDALHMVEAAKSYGFESKGFSVELENLYQMELPVILFWKFNHFVVLEGFGKNQVFINDPATGPRTISYEELDQSFTGVVLTLKPSPSFVKSGRPPSLFQALYKRIKNNKKPLFFAVLTGIGLVIPNLAFPAFTRVFIDQILINQVFTWQTGIIVGMSIAIIGTAFLRFLQGMVLNRLQSKLSLRFQSEAFWHMLQLPMQFYTQRYPGEVASRLALNESITRTITGSLATTVINVLFVLIYGVIILYYSPIIALSAILMMAMTIFFMRYAYRARANAYARYQADQGKSVAYSLGALQDIESIKASGWETKFFSQWAGYFTRVNNIQQEVGQKDIFFTVIFSLLDAFTTLLLIGIGIWQVLNGMMTVGMFIALQILLRNFTTPILQLAGFGQTIQLLKVDMARLDDMLKYPIDKLFDKKGDEQELSSDKLTGDVAIERLTFGYSPVDPPIIEEISFSLKPGKSVALIGITGCGKSTIARLLAGLYIPWKGNILFDGKDRAQIARNSITSSLALVEQYPFLFEGTLRENLTFFDSTVDHHEIVAATKDACIHEDILARPNGYDMHLNENGTNLSGGQRQRIEIARALIKKPSVLIMDEATSTLDSIVEAAIIENIKRRGAALLLISHRMSAVKNCDEILLIDRGKIVERGTHQELIKRSNLYSQFMKFDQI